MFIDKWMLLLSLAACVTWDFSKDLGVPTSIEVSSSFHHLAIMLILVDHDLHEAWNCLIAVS